jgi:phage terminase large subunit-like protein
MAQFGLRLGEFPRVVISTTPRPLSLIKELISRESEDDVTITRASTFANAANLPRSQLEQLKRRYGGTHLGLQELQGLIIDDVQGALWKREMIEQDRIDDVKKLPPMVRVVVGVDPAATSSAEADETGIVVAGRGVDGDAYVFTDRSLRASPDGWAKEAHRALLDFKGDRIVAERNNGGEMVEHTVHTVDPLIPYKGVWASRGKLTRAEPVSALYEQHRVHHVGALAKLEDEQCTWLPNDPKFPSPNRVDALVWAVTELMLAGGGPTEIIVARPGGPAGTLPRL